MGNRVPVLVKRLDRELPLPSYQTPGAAGFDLHSTETFILQPGERKLVPTGIAVAIPEGFELQIRPRSGWAYKYGISVLNTPGTVDSDYRGEVKVLLINLGDRPVKVERGERIAQGVIAPVYQGEFTEVEELPPTQRGERGFGSTGR
jgi:dUTP pyrophosphatase